MFKLLIGIILLTWGLNSSAYIRFEKGSNTIIVSNYPIDMPCNLRMIYRADKFNSWKKVAYDPGSDRYTINANLTIGMNDGSETHMQIGSYKNPGESLVLKGNLIIHPFCFIGEKGKDPRVNRLSLGNKNKPHVHVTLKITGGIYVGSVPLASGKVKRGAHGELHIYNSEISGMAENWPAQAARPCDLRGWKCAFIAENATFRNFKKAIIWGAHKYMTLSLKNCIFTDCETGFINSSRTYQFERCTFRNFKKTVFHTRTGSLKAELTDCVFENNHMNWDLSKGGYVKCVDCDTRRPINANRYSAFSDSKSKQSEYAFFISLRHITAKVVNADGEPLKGANVTVTLEGNADSQRRTVVMTKAGGLTPGKGDKSALLLTETEILAMADHQTIHRDFTYTISVEKDGAQTELKNFFPEKSWETVTLTLK